MSYSPCDPQPFDVLGPLTNTELRATPVPISGTVDTGLVQSLTNTELRATPVPISGTIDTGLVQGLTDTELRATALNVKVGTGDLTIDAWGTPKTSHPHSVFHGLFTFDVPPSQWFMYHGATQVYTSTKITSVDGSLSVVADATVPIAEVVSRATPRYQPNRGHLYSTALWMPNKTNDGIREFGLATPENGVFFRLKADGKLYAVLRSGVVETKEEEIDTTGVVGFDVQKGNVYDIQYQWRGIGNYKFYINLTLVHAFELLGTLTSLSMQDPALPAIYKCTRTTQDVSIRAGCVDITSENGDDGRLQYASAYAAATLNGTNVPLVVIYNPLTVNGKTNTRMIELAKISLNCDKNGSFRVWTTRDPTASTGATLVARGGGSFIQTDSNDANPAAVAATAVNIAKMNLVTVIPIRANIPKETVNPFQDRIDFPLVRGDYLVITATVSTGAAEAVVEWGEAI
jgi:hypothetical protein